MRIRDLLLDLAASLLAAGGFGLLAYSAVLCLGGLAMPGGVTAAALGVAMHASAVVVLRARVLGGIRLYSIPASSSAPMSCEAATVV